MIEGRVCVLYILCVDYFRIICVFIKAPFRARKEKVKREEVDRRVREDEEKYSGKFSENAKSLCKAVRFFFLSISVYFSLVSLSFLASFERSEVSPWFARSWCRRNKRTQMVRLQQLASVRSGQDATTFHTRRKKCLFLNFNETLFFFCIDKNFSSLICFQPRAVYAKDVLDIEQFSTVKGVHLDATDNHFYLKFNTGAVSIPWQNEVRREFFFLILCRFFIDFL